MIQQQNSGSPAQNNAHREIGPEDIHRIDAIRKCIVKADGPCSLGYIKDVTGYNLRDPTYSRIYEYFVRLNNEAPVKGRKIVHDRGSDTFEYVKVTPITTVDGLVKHLEEREEYRTEGIPADEVIGVLCPESVVTDARREKKVLTLLNDEKKVIRVFYFREGDDCVTLPRNEEVGGEWEKVIESIRDKKVEQLLGERKLFVFKNPETKGAVPAKPRRGRRSGALLKKTTK